MVHFWRLLYSLITIPILWTLLQILGLFNAKVRRGIAGRKHLFADLEAQISRLGEGRRIWVHSSSMGEFEQAKPIIAALKERLPQVKVIVTFYSPSGFENSRKYPLADAISYLPFDTRRNARRFFDLVRPDVGVMVRYDIWPNHVWEMRDRGIPSGIANATMRRQTERRIPFARTFHHYVYNALDLIMTVSQTDADMFRVFSLSHPRIEVIGDTRFDQVRIRSQEARKHMIVPPAVLENRLVVVAGSTWPEDEEVFLPAFLDLAATNPRLLMILVPHEPTVQHLENLESDLDGRISCIRFSALREYRDERVIIVDSIGILLTLYSYAHVAFVGGGFKQNVHNVLEAAVYGIPVLFGPRHWNSQEPIMLAGHGGGFVITDSGEMKRTLGNLLGDDLARAESGAKASRFVESHTGATDRVVEYLQPLLTSTRTLSP